MEMEGKSQQGQQQDQIKKQIEFTDLNDFVIGKILRKFDKNDLRNVALTCKRLYRIARNFLSHKYPKSPKELSLRLSDSIRDPCPSLDATLRLNPDVEILHLETYDSWEELYPIAKHLSRLRELDLKIYVVGYNHIFYSDERIQKMLCIAYERNLPIQRLKLDMEFGYIVNMLWMIAENLTQLKELELEFVYEMCVGEIEDVDSLRFKTLEKLSVQCSKHRGEDFAAMKSIAMFAFDELKDLTLKRLNASLSEAVQFIVRQDKLQKLKLIDCSGMNVQVLGEIKENLPQLEELVTDVDEQSMNLLKQRFGSGWIVTEHSETYDKQLRKAWRFTLIET